jgi:TPP-dependent 2-oxoacid decarboxylase
MPEDVGTARQLWWGVIGFGVVQLIASMIAALDQRRTFAEEVFEQARVQDPQVTMASAELIVSLVYVVVVLIGLGVAALASVIVHQFGRGKPWARTVLTVLGAWVVVIGVGALLAIEAVAGMASLVAGGASIVQAVLAVGAIYLSHRPDSTAYFQPGGR